MGHFPDRSERRGSRRTPSQNQATTLIELLLRSPSQATRRLTEELGSGVSPAVVLAKLDHAESLSRSRGLNLSAAIHTARRRLADAVAGLGRRPGSPDAQP